MVLAARTVNIRSWVSLKLDTFNIYDKAECQGLYWRRKLGSPQHVSIMESRLPSVKRRMLSFTILERFTPPMACSMRILLEEIRRLVAFSGGVSAPPRGVCFGWTSVRPGRTKPWTP